MLERTTRFYLAPYDDIRTPLLSMISAAASSIYMEIYGFTLPELVDLLISKASSGVYVGLLLDSTQAAGKAERDQLERIKGSKIEYYIGTSPRHRIRHSKFTIVDREWVEDGSLNYSASAFLQNNSVRISKDAQLAELLIEDWKRNKEWILKNGKK